MSAPDPRLLGDDPQAFVAEIEKLAQAGDFNPFAMLAGELCFHSAFLAPLSPSLTTAVAEFLASGSGPLAGAVESLIGQGLDPVAARAKANELFAGAQGMFVTVLATDSGLATIPQLFFGHFDPAWCEHASRAVTGEGQSAGQGGSAKPGLDPAPVQAAIRDLARLAGSGRNWPALISGPEAKAPAVYWPALAGRLIDGIDRGLLPPARERLADLAHWIGAAASALNLRPTGATATLLVRCHLLAGETERAGAMVEVIAAPVLKGDDNADDVVDALVDAVTRLTDTAVAHGSAADAAAWLAHRLPAWDQALGGSYELRLALVRLHAAAGSAGLVEAAAQLVQRNRKSARHDLTREPIWQVTSPAEDGLDTVAAAEVIGRSPAFVAKRLEQRTIPFQRLDAAAGQPSAVRLPRAALLAWKQVMDSHRLLD